MHSRRSKDFIESYEASKRLRDEPAFVEPIEDVLRFCERSGFDVQTRGTEPISFLRHSVIEGEEKDLESLQEQHGENFIVATDDEIDPNRSLNGALDVDAENPDINVWHKEKLGIVDVWRQFPQYDGRNVRVAVLDSGINLVDDLMNRIDSAYRYEPASGRMIPHQGGDTEYHGTFIAGLIVGRQTGVAPEARLVDFLAVPYGKISYVSRFIAAIDTILGSEPCDIVNISAGVERPNEVFEEVLKELQDSGILTIAAMGNGGRGTSVSPGNSRYSLGVGGSTEDNLPYLHHGSGTYSDDQGRWRKPDIIAPGKDVISTGFQGGYLKDSGSSMATAIATGLAASYLSAFPSLNAKSLRKLLIDSCVSLGFPQDDEGYGLVTANKFWPTASV